MRLPFCTLFFFRVTSIFLATPHSMQGFSEGSAAWNAGDTGDSGSIPGSGRFPGGGQGNPLQCSCLENPRDRGAWWAGVYGVIQSQTRLKRLSKYTWHASWILVPQPVIEPATSALEAWSLNQTSLDRQGSPSFRVTLIPTQT